MLIKFRRRGGMQDLQAPKEKLITPYPNKCSLNRSPCVMENKQKQRETGREAEEKKAGMLVANSLFRRRIGIGP